MNLNLKVLFAIFNFFLISSSEIIEIEDGKIEGTLMEDRLGEKFHAFLGIPFAEPPINELRFKAPVPKSPWPTTRNCTVYGPMCSQPNKWNNHPISEDCLHLNVFSKTILISDATADPKPVIAYFHGGAFETGSSIEHGPEYLMEREVVVVTINYRLGAFGFLALDVEEISGNAGLKDQVLALKWIQRNIRYFGGDPEKVTLAGLSAGGYSVTAHMISPMSQGLFKNVIAMSGALAWQKKLRTNNIHEAKQLAKRINCSDESIGDMINCLRAKSAEEIANNEINSLLACPIMTWLPVIESDLGQERFLTEDPNDSFRGGKFEKVNVMVGVTADEFIAPAATIVNDDEMTKVLNENFDEIAPICFFFDENQSKIGKRLREFYLPFETIDKRSLNSLNNLFSDGVIGYGVHRFVHYISNFTNVFYYKFSYSGRFSVFKLPNDKPYGVHHADDIQYCFNAAYVGPMINKTDPENLMVERMTRMWSSFAATGNPNNISDEYLKDLSWPKHDLQSESYLDIGNNLVSKNGLFLERFTVWDRLDASQGTNSSSLSSIKISFTFVFILNSLLFMCLT